MIEALGLVGAFAFDDDLLLLDRGFAFEGFRLGFRLHFRILRGLARDDFSAPNAPSTGGMRSEFTCAGPNGILDGLVRVSRPLPAA